MRILNGTLLSAEGPAVKDGFVDFERGRITACGSLRQAPAYGGEIFDAKGGYITPGFIDAHTHIGISEEGLRWEGEDCNETAEPVTPDMRAADGFNPFDTAIPKAVAAGVTSAGVSPGSTNVIGGQIASVKLRGASLEEMLIKGSAGIKFALGENPKNCHGEKHGRSPVTRMATAAMMRSTLESARLYMNKKERGDEVYDPKLEPLLPLLRREIPAHFHAHRADDIQAAVRMAEEFGLRCCVLHATDSERIMPWLAGKSATLIIGPSEGPAGKPESAGCSFATAGRMAAAGLEVCITTDHDVTPLWMLPVYAALCVREGMDEAEAIKAISINPARALDAEDRIGSIKPGKDADIAVFTGHPFDFRSKASAVFIDGVLMR